MRVQRGSEKVAWLSALLLAASCSYDYGARVGGHQFSGVGWDSGIAYGDARETAIQYGHNRLPDGVSANCQMVFVKALLAGAAIAIAVKAAESDAGRIGVGVGTIAAMALIPNCFATLTYVPRPEAAESPPDVDFSGGVPRRFRSVQPKNPSPLPVSPAAPDRTDPSPASPP